MDWLTIVKLTATRKNAVKTKKKVKYTPKYNINQGETMEPITKEEIEEIRRRDERLLNLKEDILNMGPNQFVLGGYVNTIYESDPIDNNKIRVIHDRKYRREYTRKAYQEFRKKWKKTEEQF